MLTTAAPPLHVADAILYLASLRSARPRPIDRHIDYFGEARPGRSEGRRPRPRRPPRRSRRVEAAG